MCALHTLRMLPITGKTQLLAVIGCPIGHSLSPLMHNAALAEMGLDWCYVALPIAPEDLAIGLAGMLAIGVRGFNVTIPHKQVILPLLGSVAPVAGAVGAVNTVWRSELGWCGTNTDVAGFIGPLRGLDRDWSTTRVLVLGHGGAARAVVAGCRELGCGAVRVVGRDADRLAAFRDSWSADYGLTNGLTIAPWADLDQHISSADLIVNTTPIGMAPNTDASPLTDAQAELIRADAIAYDLIYVPNPTRFLQQAAGRGAMAIDGLEMLVGQGAAALQIWTGQEVPIATMRRTLQQHLGLA
jgi:shikimate dehydrogenase